MIAPRLSALLRGSQRGILGSSRSFSTSSLRSETFRIQSMDDFKEKVLESEVPVIVDFSAVWCGPCKILGPRLDAAIAVTEGKVNLAIVDIDDHADLAMDHSVSAVPTVLAMKDGEVVDKFVGLIEEDKLLSFIGNLHE
ncbi:Thioredoxin [Caligus rogercresseyi]|uniref:Thioredoxin n=1 Tax=Caligus rogercresseyi TaxID=217165 RepID=A0A7T8GX11_CALRO|nr:Thioredoxin [Caligus rogercresseyi]|eukprot:TRINITY_DN18406_c0_g1_i1.p1 TRINITY_DN18406_c0_g1~~TRINITY_DN18406_c0_g1_i1.p1  ORF type:complete len:139 (-),score=45.63 TRINITY_DN18406_c0_g1_i1:103-519(-)